MRLLRWHPPRSPAAPPAVVITVPSYAGALDALRDVEVRVGNTAPTAALDPSTMNTVCATTAGRLGTVAGGEVRITCAGGPKLGRLVTVQIR